MEKEFKKELKALLKKYNATIGFDCSDCSDTYGLSGERIVAEVNGKEVISAYGWTLNQGDI